MMEFQTFDFHGKTIRGFLHQEGHQDLVIVLHGFMGNKVDHHFMMKSFAETIVSCGFDVYRFDFLGSGDSDGSFYEEERIANQIAQVTCLIESFQKRGYRIHLFAFSMGGVVATHVSKQASIASMFLLSPAGNFDEILTGMLALGSACEDGYEFNGYHIHPDFVEEAKNFPYFDELAYEGMVKIVQGSKDQYVSMDSFMKYQTCYPQCDSKQIIGADHCYSTLAHTRSVRKEIVEFYGKVKNMAIKE